MKNLYAVFHPYLELCKIRISLLSSLSAAAGFALSAFGVKAQLMFLIPGVFFLACGACSLNQYQERHLDAVMTRTRNRPLPSGKIKPHSALLFSLLLMAAGLILLIELSLISAGLGLFAVLWYNGVYTCLKKKSAFAVIPGALTGAAAPAIGWVSGGGPLTDHRIGVLCLCLFLWQVPHTWLLHLDYKEDYKKAGLPSLTDLFTETQLLRIIFIWIISTSVAALFLSTGMMQTPFITFFIFAISSWLFYWGFKLLRDRDIPYALVFNKINIYMIFLLIIISLDYMIISL